MSFIKDWLAGVLRALDDAVERPMAWADARIDRAMTCPTCGHGPHASLEEAAECSCEDADCECTYTCPACSHVTLGLSDPLSDPDCRCDHEECGCAEAREFQEATRG